MMFNCSFDTDAQRRAFASLTALATGRRSTWRYANR
jgi:hypothetical protein